MSKSGCASFESPKLKLHESSARRWFTHLMWPSAASKAMKASLLPVVGWLEVGVL
jgi:hypothetical protein